MSDRMDRGECRRLLGNEAEGLTDDEIVTIRDEAYEVAAVIAEAHDDIVIRSEDLESSGADAPDFLTLALGLTREDLEMIEDELDRESSAQIDEVLREHENE